MLTEPITDEQQRVDAACRLNNSTAVTPSFHATELLVAFLTYVIKYKTDHRPRIAFTGSGREKFRGMLPNEIKAQEGDATMFLTDQPPGQTIFVTLPVVLAGIAGSGSNLVHRKA